MSVSPHRIIRDGQDPLTEPILDYLEYRYGDQITPDIRRVQLDSEIGSPQIITLELYVRVEKP